MAQTIKLKRSAVAAKAPLTTDLALGELAINTFDGKMYFKKNVSGTDSIITLANDDEVVKLTGTQSIAGLKTFTNNLTINAGTGQTSLSVGPLSGNTWSGFLYDHSTSAGNVLANEGVFNSLVLNRFVSTTSAKGNIYFWTAAAATNGGGDIVFAANPATNTPRAGIYGSIQNLKVPTTDYEAANKKYVDDQDALKANDSAVVKLTGNQTIAGVKTFSDIITISNTTTSNSTTTGALVVSGGLGVAKTINTGENATINSINIGKLNGSNNLVFGNNSGTNFNTNAIGAVVIGSDCLSTVKYSIGNIAIGFEALKNFTTGIQFLTNSTPGSGGGAGPFNNVQLEKDSGTDTMDTYPIVNLTMSSGAVASITVVNAGTGLTGTNLVLKANSTAIAAGVPSNWSCTVFVASGYNTSFGYQVLKNTTTGSYNLGIGSLALNANTTGTFNNAIGVTSLTANTTGSNNTAIGVSSLLANTTGSENISIGSCLAANTTGSSNVSIGLYSLQSNTTANENTAIGFRAGLANITGSNNIFIGSTAGRFHSNGTTTLTDPEGCVYIGAEARGLNNNDSNSVVIAGRTATARGVGEGANTTVIGNTTTTSTKLFGKTTSQTNTATTNAVVHGLRTEHQSSGTPAVGIGTGIEFAAETSANNTEVGATVEAITTNVTSTTEAFDLLFRTMSGGAAAAERFRITSEGNVTLQGNTIRVVGSRTPASATAAGTAGEICWDASYIYVCTATNTWRRIAHATW